MRSCSSDPVCAPARLTCRTAAPLYAPGSGASTVARWRSASSTTPAAGVGSRPARARATPRKGDLGVLSTSREAARHRNVERRGFYLGNCFRMVGKADAGTGLVFRPLEASRFCDNTLVILATDRGDVFSHAIAR
jgi:hypothetical protein